ncbi:DNA topoisomerase 1 [Trametes pubescens]|uniref:DNA topoisomerase I n=1 Tax=Trametes pubescens TaxID=154538 RepID=A0A1M2W605_TRAPU|nr:DNA topoisomerase 1 [Trametes pubescens]
MSGDISMLSDDDTPLSVKPSARGTQNGHVIQNGNGRVLSDSPMSEDDDMPLSQTTRTKSEPMTPDVRSLKRKKPAMMSESSSEDDKPLASSPAKSKSAAISMPGAVEQTTTKAPTANGKRARTSSKAVVESSEDEDDAPLAKPKRVANGKAKPKGRPAKKVKKEESEPDIESEDGTPVPARKAPPRVKRKMKDESDADDSPSEDDKPLTKKRATKTPAAKKTKGKGKAEASEDVKPKKRGAKKEETEDSKLASKKKEEMDEDTYKWWEQQNAARDGSVKWTMLEHNGVYFPPAYEPLPKHVKMKYNGEPVDLPVESEEVAGFYGALIESPHAQDVTFNKNFFDDFLKVLKKYPPRNGVKITKFELCDFRPMYEYFESEKEKKKSMTTAEKKAAKAAKDELEAPYTHCTLDGRKEKVGNFRIEPPGLFRGRGDHPKKGALKHRLRPEDITINIGKDSPVPTPNVPGKWKDVVHDNTVTWLANWVENVNGNYKYVFLAAGSSLKGQSDMQKFEKARELKKHVDRIRADYQADLKTKQMMERQRATAMYFIDKLALRAGNEKGDEEADTVGCCSLRCEHVTLLPPNKLVFDFLGKDSIRYYNEVQVDDQVYKNIRIFKGNKNDEDELFDRVNTGALNKHLASYMKGLTAKVFRTFNASLTFQELLDRGTPDKGTTQEKLNAYNHANRMVAILCNHQRAVPKTHEQSMTKMREKLRGLKYERMKLRHALFSIDSKFKKKKKYQEPESDLDDEAIESHEEQLKAKDLEKAEKKFQKDNEKLVEDGKKPQDDSVLKEKLKEVEAEYKRLKKERGTEKHALKKERPTEKIEDAIDKLDEKIKAFKLQMEDREAGKEVALSTSKINYLDPRITVAWCKDNDVPVEKLFSKTLITKFPWAMEADPEWKF